MPLTILQLFQRYSEIKWYRKLYIKRYDPNTDTFETDWYDVSQYLIKDSVSSINRQLPQDNYSFGTVRLDNCNLELRNIYGGMSDEDNANSVFKNWQRHNSKIRIVEGYVDDKTDPDNQVAIEAIVFEGLIDDFQAETTVKYTERFVAKDKLSVLERYTMGDIGTLSSTTINTIVYEILNRDIFTKYFTVSNSLTYINAGYDASSCDMTQYTSDQTVFEVLNNLSFGHSIFFIDSTTDTFSFLPVTPTPTVQYEFKDILAKRIRVDKYMTGADKVIEDWYWENTNISALSTTHKYYTSNVMNIKAVTNTVQRTNLINYVKNLTNTKKLHFDVIMPYFPIIKMLDRVNFTLTGVITDDAFLLDIGRLDIDKLREPVGAITLTAADEFYVRGIKHSKLTTTIHVQKI
jgi:hypothetical protein